MTLFKLKKKMFTALSSLGVLRAPLGILLLAPTLLPCSLDCYCLGFSAAFTELGEQCSVQILFEKNGKILDICELSRLLYGDL